MDTLRVSGPMTGRALRPLVALLTAFCLQSAFADEGEQTIRAFEGYVRDSGERGSATVQQLKEQRTARAEVLSKPRSNGVMTSTTLADQWIYDADVELYDDLDDDGYFRFISVRFDADTYLASSWVYAMLYLSADGETWEHYYTTNDFLIGGTVVDDEYFVETELLDGYPPGLYDVLIELYDADLVLFADEFGPADSSAMSLLPVEDASFDVPPVVVAVTHEHGGGGSFSWTVLALLTTLLLIQRLHRQAAGRKKAVSRPLSYVRLPGRLPNRPHPLAARPCRDPREPSDT